MKKIKKWSYGLWLCMLIAAYAYLSYLFEALCVIVFFELLMELDVSTEKQMIHE